MRDMNATWVGMAIALLALVSGPHAHALLLLDAHYEPVLTHTASIATPPSTPHSFEDYAQTFTTQHSGVITGIEVQISRGIAPAGPLLFELLTTADGRPSVEGPATVVASADAPLASITASLPQYQWYAFENLNVPVTAGQSLAIVLQNDSGGYYGWGCRVGSTYEAGRLFRRAVGVSDPPGGTWTSVDGYDAAFRVWLDVDTIIPEPSAFVLMLAVLGLAIRRNHSISHR
jgi:hypothetical protein